MRQDRVEGAFRGSPPPGLRGAYVRTLYFLAIRALGKFQYDSANVRRMIRDQSATLTGTGFYGELFPSRRIESKAVFAGCVIDRVAEREGAAGVNGVPPEAAAVAHGSWAMAMVQRRRWRCDNAESMKVLGILSREYPQARVSACGGGLAMARDRVENTLDAGAWYSAKRIRPACQDRHWDTVHPAGG